MLPYTERTMLAQRSESSIESMIIPKGRCGCHKLDLHGFNFYQGFS